jgi:uncharacterized OB-fold protein
MTAERPLPEVTDQNRPFWESARAGRLTLQRCKNCGQWRYPPARHCYRCLSDEAEWAPVSGRGTVYSFVVFHQAFHPAFKEQVPYNVAVVELVEGPRLVSNIVDCRNEEIYVGMPVEAVYEPVTDEVTLVKFRPVEVWERADAVVD